MRALIVGCLLLVATGANAACRLSTSECGVIAEEMRQEAIQQIVDERNPPPGMSRYQAGLWAIDQHADRLRSRLPMLGQRIGLEYVRIEHCQISARAVVYNPSAATEPQCLN